MYISAVLMTGGLLALTAGFMLIFKALFLRVKKRFRPETLDRDQEFSALNKGRKDTRLGMMLISSGCALAAPEFLGLTFEPTTLTILAFLLIFFLTAYWRYAKQLRTGQPQR
jgi:hypothetical protein